MTAKRLYWSETFYQTQPTPAGSWSYNIASGIRSLMSTPPPGLTGNNPASNATNIYPGVSGDSFLTAQCATWSSNIALTSGTLSGTVEPVSLTEITNIVSGTPALRFYVWVSQGTTSSVRGVALDYTTAFGAVPPGGYASYYSPGPLTLTDVAVQAGDRIIMEFGCVLNATSGSAARNTFYSPPGCGPDPVGGDTAGVGTRPAYVEFSDTNDVISVTSQPPLRLYLANSSPSFTPSTIRGTWQDSSTASAVVGSLSTSPSGATTTSAVTETSTSNGALLLGRFVSEPVTTGGSTNGVSVVDKAIRSNYSLRESSTAANMYPCWHIYATQGSTDSLRGSIASATSSHAVIEASTTQAAKAAPTIVSSSVTLQVGDRIVVEVGCHAFNTSSTAYTGTLQYGGTGSDLAWNSTSGVGWFELFGFSQFFVGSTGTTANATDATGAGDAHNATVAVDSNAQAEGPPAGLGDAFAGTVSLVLASGLATGDGDTFGPTVSTVSSSGASGGLAGGAGDAFAPGYSVSQGAGVALGAGDTPGAGVSTAVAAGSPEGIGDAIAAAHVLAASAALAMGAGDTFNATISTTADTFANANVAQGVVDTYTAGPSVQAAASLAGGTGASYNATVSTVAEALADAGAALGVGDGFSASPIGSASVAGGSVTGVGEAFVVSVSIETLGVLAAAAGAAFSATVAVDSIVLPGAVLGDGAAFPAVASTIGSDPLVHRPSAGTISRPDSGLVIRPATYV